MLLAVAGAALLGGCSSLPSIPNPLDLVSGPATLHVEVPAQPGALPVLRSGQALKIAVSDFSDGRSRGLGRKVGDIRATVLNIHATEVALDQEPASLVTGAVRNQLAKDGFRVVGSAESPEFRLSGVLRKAYITIAGRDEVEVAAEVTLRETRSGDVIWAGVVTDKRDRYAGVSGNSRATIEEYLGEGTAEFAARLSAVVRDALLKSYPSTLAATAGPSVAAVPGVTTVHAPVARDKVAEPAPKPVAVPAAAPAPAPAFAPARIPGPEVGYVSIYSSPARAKVYLGDVYYGMTPLKIELPVGIKQFRFKLSGYKEVTEKLAVRRGETTDLEVQFEK